MPDPTLLTPIVAVPAGVTVPGENADTNGNLYANTGEQVVEIYNGDAGTITVTIHTNKTLDGLTVPNRTVTVTGTTRALLGPYPPTVYNNASGQVLLTYSAVTSVTVRAIKVVPDQG